MTFNDFLLDPIGFMIALLMSVVGLFLFAAVMAGVSYLIFLVYKFRNREKDSLNTTLLQVSVPRDNEIKIDAAEQLFSSFA
ncbi:MAG: hypothetical protein UT44_C0029G0001, partial [Candidatus Levybacteria bacterium GW2011_GWA1_39_32]